MNQTIGRQTVSKVGWRLLPIIILMYFLSYLDRVNVSFAALTMNKDLAFTATIYGWGAGLFFVGYFLGEVPSNLALERFGARIWLARIMITWGAVSAAMALVSGPWSFYLIRFLLGLAEAGLFPGVILYLTYWFPARARSRMIALFLAAAPLSTLIARRSPATFLGSTALSPCAVGSGCSSWKACRPCWLASIFSSCFRTVPNTLAGSPGTSATGLPANSRRKMRSAPRRVTTGSVRLSAIHACWLTAFGICWW
jgi:MFS family permease